MSSSSDGDRHLCCGAYSGISGHVHITGDVLVGSKVRYLPHFSAVHHFSERPESAQTRHWRGHQQRTAIHPEAVAPEIKNSGAAVVFTLEPPPKGEIPDDHREELRQGAAA